MSSAAYRTDDSRLPVVSTDRTNLPPWGEKEISRFKFRVGLFVRRGMSEHDAEVWADRLFERDYERDDRRICLECQHLQRSGGCFAAAQGWIKGADKRMQPIKDLLQRCECFSWQTP
jgi:hypothetical protein